MRKFIFRKLEDSIFATREGWTNEYTPDGDVDTSIEHSNGEEMTQAEAKKILYSYGWNICEKCGDIFPEGGDCECFQQEERNTHIQIRIEESLKNDFYSKCEENYQTPSVVLRGLIKKYLEEEI
jgi:hypothetical protein